MKSRDTLHGTITLSLRTGEKSSGFDNALLTSDHTRVNHKHETELWDYKEALNLNDKIETAKLAKQVMAFHNNRGGCIIVGVRDDFSICGVRKTAVVDTKQLRGALRKYTGHLEVFQDQVPSQFPDRVLWLVFVPPRTGSPVAARSNAPDPIVGKRAFRKGQYFVRVGDESKLVQEPADYERLFSGVSFTHLTAYEYDVDEPYYLLLSPHHDQLIGRHALKDQLYEALNSRSYIVSLDGVGGVGKSALAIDVVRQLYDSGEYEFIISLSAKAKVWQQGSSGRKAHFTGLAELLKEMARVLYPEGSWASLDSMKIDLLELMKGNNGLIFVDNLENVTDDNVFGFLKEIPHPVRVLITSKVRRGALPMDTLFVPEMTEEEGRMLFSHELKRIGAISDLGRSETIDKIVEAAGRLPLAIKWAASLALSDNSLPRVLEEFQKGGVQKYEFLSYCFSEMVDGLSPVARECALLCPYLPDESWNTSMLSLALSRNPFEIDAAIGELESRGLIVRGTHADTRFVLPLTMDFLSERLRKNKHFRQEVDRRLSDAIPEANDEFLGMSPNRKGELLYDRAIELVEKGEYALAQTRLELALQYAREADYKLAIKCRCLDARLRDQKGEHRAAIDQMRAALTPVQDIPEFANEFLWLGGSILRFGARAERAEAIDQIVAAIRAGATGPLEAVKTFCEHTTGEEKYEQTLIDAIRGVKDRSVAHHLISAVWNKLQSDQFLFTIGRPVVSAVTKASEKAESDGEREDLRALLKHIRKLLG